MCVCVCLHVYMYACVRVCMCGRVFACMCVYVFAFVVHELLDYEQKSTGIPSHRIILGNLVPFLLMFTILVYFCLLFLFSLHCFPGYLSSGGLSQGGSLAMLAALTYSKPLAGIVALSTWMSLHEKIPEVSKSAWEAR